MAGTNQITFTDKVNTRTLPIPSQNKVRDVDLNEIKQEHNALDTIVTDPETGLVKVVEDLETALGTAESGIETLGTSKEDSANKTDSFDVINETLFPNWKGVQDYTNSTFLTPNSNQFIENIGVADLSTIYDNSTIQNVSFEKSVIHGTENLPIYYSLTASLTGAKHRNNVLVIHSSLVTPTLLVDPLAEDWGTKPEWLNITGSYLIGADNINYLDFTYSRITGEVDLVITSKVGGNLDPNRIITLHKIIDLDYNDFADPVLADSVINKSIYGSAFNPLIVNPSEADFRDFGDGNFGLEMGFGGSSNPDVRSHHYIDQTNEHLSTLWESEEITVIVLQAFGVQGTFTRRTFFSMVDLINFTGFAFGTGDTNPSNLRMTAGNGTSNATNSVDSTAPITLTEDEARYFIAGTFIKTDTSAYTVDFYWSSLDKGQPFQRLGDSRDLTTVRTINAPTARILLNRRLETDSTMDPTIHKNLQVFNKRLTMSEIEAIRDTLDVTYE